MRLFIGIPLDATVVAELTALVAPLQSPGDGLRWAPPAGWHITLQFLGATKPEQYACVAAGLRLIRHAPFVIHLDPPGFFDRAGVFFAGVQLSPELTALQQKVIAATTPCGFVPEDRPYRPHITLARKKGHSSGLQQLKSRVPPGVRFSAFTAREFLLYESFPAQRGRATRSASGSRS